MWSEVIKPLLQANFQAKGVMKHRTRLKYLLVFILSDPVDDPDTQISAAMW